MTKCHSPAHIGNAMPTVSWLGIGAAFSEIGQLAAGMRRDNHLFAIFALPDKSIRQGENFCKKTCSFHLNRLLMSLLEVKAGVSVRSRFGVEVRRRRHKTIHDTADGRHPIFVVRVWGEVCEGEFGFFCRLNHISIAEIIVVGAVCYAGYFDAITDGFRHGIPEQQRGDIGDFIGFERHGRQTSAAVAGGRSEYVIGRIKCWEFAFLASSHQQHKAKRGEKKVRFHNFISFR